MLKHRTRSVVALAISSAGLLLSGCPGCGDTNSDDVDPDPRIIDECLATEGEPDGDGDGILDDCDVCEGSDLTGDTDGDGVCDDVDPCPVDADDDTDGDGVCDTDDACPNGDDEEDADGDGFSCRVDCDDADPEQYPGALWYPDGDGDGYGSDDVEPVARCTPPAGHVLVGGDCNDSDPMVAPGRIEWCDGVDSDCDDSTDEPFFAVHELKDGQWTDLTHEFVNTTAESPKSYTTTADTLLGVCNVPGHYTFDVGHPLRVVGVAEPIFYGGDVPTFTIGDPDATALDPQVTLTVEGVHTEGGASSFVDASWATVELRNVEQRGVQAAAGRGGLVQGVGSDVTLEFVGAHALGGRALHLVKSHLDAQEVTFDGFSSSEPGGAVFAQMSDLEVTNGTFANCSTEQSGGAIYSDMGSLELEFTDFMDNSASGGAQANNDGGAIAARYTAVRGSGLEFVRNSAGNLGGAIALSYSVGPMRFEDSTFTQNRSFSGGAIGVELAELELNYVSVIANTADDSGGAISVSQSELSGVGLLTLNNRSAHEGGAIRMLDSYLHLTDATFRGNETQSGGAIALRDASRGLLDGSCLMHGNRGSAPWGSSAAIQTFTGSEFVSTGCDMGATDIEWNSPRAATDGSSGLQRPTSSFRCHEGCAEYDTSDATNDTDGDGIPNEWDVCSGDDTADVDQDGIPCYFDRDEGDAPACPEGHVEDADRGCVLNSCDFVSGDCPITRSCAELKIARPELGSGQYVIDVDGDGPTGPTLVSCDMEADGGGWTLVLNYARGADYGDTRLRLHTTSFPLAGEAPTYPFWATPRWGHVGNAMFASLDPTEVRFYGRSNHPISPNVIHFVSSHPGTLEYFETGQGSAEGIHQGFTALNGHNASLPGDATAFEEDQGDYALTQAPFSISGGARWLLAPVGLFNVDDYYDDDPTPYDTLHQVWAR